MARVTAVEDKLARLSAIDPRAADASSQLRAATHDKSSLVIARAANLAIRAQLPDLSDDLAAAFTRLLAGGTSADRGCIAKLAIAQALYQFGTGSPELFLAGIHHVQLEPVLGGTADTAPELRGTCALGLVRIGYPRALMELADLLGDPEPQASIMAARALAYSGSEFATLPLRVKIRCERKSPEILGECFAALLKLTPEASVQPIGRFLEDGNRDLAAEAALALASSRLPAAGDLLLQAWARDPRPDRRELLLSPLAITRRSEAIDLLIGTIERASADLACSALDALGIFRSDADVRGRALAAAETREARVKSAAAKAFPG